jgi:GNAT superfamily N-acetyltransferase
MTNRSVLSAGIRFERIEDSEGDCNRGWQVDKLVAWMDGIRSVGIGIDGSPEEVGYLKLAYIPKKRFDDHFKAGALSYADQIAGHRVFPAPKDWETNPDARASHDIDGFDDHQLREFVRGASWSFLNRDFSYGASHAKLQSMDRRQLMDQVKEIRAAVEHRFSAEYRRFRRNVVDKPMVDFIRVHDGYRRLGIATALYVEGARWMAEKGLRLYASSNQSTEAAAAWGWMQNAGWVNRDSRGLHLVAQKIPLAVTVESILSIKAKRGHIGRVLSGSVDIRMDEPTRPRRPINNMNNVTNGPRGARLI